MKGLRCSLTAAVLLLGAGAAPVYQIDLTHYFPSTSAEAQTRAVAVADANRFIASPTPATASAMRAWLDEYNGLLERLERHDIYVYLRAESDDQDAVDAKSDDALGALEDRMSDRIAEAAQQLGTARIARMTQQLALARYRYLLEASLATAKHRLTPNESRVVELSVTPVLDAAGRTYRALRKSGDPIERHQDAYAALLVSIVAARNGIARLRGFAGAAQASYFDKSISPASVERTLVGVRASTSFAKYLAVAALAPKPAFTPPAQPIGSAIPVILAAEQPMGPEYASAYAALLDPQNQRLEICTASRCDDTGFSLGFAGVESAVFYGGYNGSLNAMRAVAHESGHAVHRHFMNLGQPVAAYNQGPAFMFESFAIFNELLFLDHLYETAKNDTQRAYYLNAFLADATFQVFGSAIETELESAIYRGVENGTIRTAADFDALTSEVFARYDPASAKDAATPLYWARDRLYFTDPLYDVNYLYAGLLALRYFTDLQADPASFAPRFVAMLRNGFNAPPEVLEKRFLGIELSDEANLVANACALIDARTAMLAKLYEQ